MVRTGANDDGTATWRAAGQCARCATPISRPTQGEGVWPVACPSCGERTGLRARRDPPIPSVRRAGDPKTTPVGLPKLSRRERRRAAEARGHAATLPRVERRRRNLWAAPTLAGGFLIVALAAFLAFGPVPTPEVPEEATQGADVPRSQVQLFLNDTAASSTTVLLQLLHDGALVHEERVATADDANATTNGTQLALTAAAPAGPLQVRILDDAENVLLDTTVDAAACAGGLLRIGLALDAEGARVEEASCVTP